MWIPDPRFEEPSLLVPGKKPVGKSVIDFGNPLAKDLRLFLLTFTESAAVNLVTGNTQRGYITSPEKVGNILKFNSPSRNDEVLVTPDVELSGLGAFTYAIHLRFTGSSSSDEDSIGGAWSQRQGINSAPEQWLMRYGTNNSTLDVFIDTGSQSSIAITNPMLDGLFHVVGCVYTGAEISLWADGKKLGSTAKTGILPSSGAQEMETPGGHKSTGEGGNNRVDAPRVDMLSSMFWYRGLADAEMAVITKSPYQFLIPA